MKRRWFLFFFKKSVTQRKGRIFIASASVTLAVAVITGMLGITLGIRDKLGSELKAYGANIIVSVEKPQKLDLASRKTAASIRDVEDVSGQFFTSARVSSAQSEVIGLDISRLKGMGWRLEGRLPETPGEILAGRNIREMLGLKAGGRVELEGDSGKKDFTVVGFTEKGGAEDSAFIMSLEDSWKLGGAEGELSALFVRGKSGRLDEIAKEIKSTIQGVTVKTFRQVAYAEESLLSKIQLLMVMVTAIVLFAAAVSVAGTMGANVLERREEIGLMKAIGAERAEISLFYRAESALTGLIGGGAGFVIGFGSAQLISKGAFGSFIGLPYYLPVVSICAGVGISMISGWFPVRDAMKYNPAVILRGE